MKVRALLLAVVLLALAGISGLAADRAREEAGILDSAARIPLGGFEPVAVNILFLRANKLIEEQRLPEAIAAVRLVTELQPRVPDGWAVLGHYLAWRNSESAADPEAEWVYAREGLRVLERGLEHNPESERLFFSLGLFFLMRLQEQDDVKPIALRELALPPAAFAYEAFQSSYELGGRMPAFRGMAESARLLGYDLDEYGQPEAALKALRIALAHFTTLAKPESAELARGRVKEIADKIAEIEGR